LNESNESIIDLYGKKTKVLINFQKIPQNHQIVTEKKEILIKKNKKRAKLNTFNNQLNDLK
jgi:hypothetical protein